MQQKLNQPYDTQNWKEIVQYVFPNVQLLGSPRIITVNNEKVESFSQLGNVRLNDGKNLALFELTLKPHVNILRNRVELNNLVSQFIDQEQTHGVLSVFEQGQDDYRFTFSARATEFDEEAGDFRVSRTDTKRYTYVLGKNESCKTPAERFFSLAEKKNDADIKAIQDAFSVEKLSKEFFNGYKEHYLNFVQYINGKRPRKVNNKWEDQVIHQPHAMYQYIFNGQDKAVRDFVKLMLGRLVFIHFVQKKRWLGVPADQGNWNGGDLNFLYNAFQKFEHKGLFYSHFLEPLFSDALNRPGRSNDIFSVTGTRIPFLNGGLFEKGEFDTASADFPADLFKNLLEFFGHYNFTIDESDPSEREVGIDPEMLGHIFENLLEDNKDKGAFYTPKEIVHYMCQESLKEYLKTYLEGQNLWPQDEANSTIMEQALEAFIKRKEAGQVIDFDKAMATALRDVKICDPAIGSGAFPMGLLNEIYHCMFTLYHASPDVVGDVWGMESWEADTVKKNIIQNSIYGVDIEKGAVDIARLRFWLSLLIEEDFPNPLPNLDYKIVVGNSLVSKLGDEVIDIDWGLNETLYGFFGADLARENTELLKKISRKQREFFNPESDKKKLSDDIRNLKIDLLINQLELMIVTKGLETQPTDSGRNLSQQTEVYLQTCGWKENIRHLKILKESPEKPVCFFDWKLDFPEVMNGQVCKKTGFDIVIANPPYIGSKGNEDIFHEIQRSTIGKRFYTRWVDYFYFFFHLGIDLLKENGNLNYITTNYFFTSTGGVKLREDLLKRTTVKLIVDFGDLKIFESALGQHNCITIIQKAHSKELTTTKVFTGKGTADETILRKLLYSFPEIFDVQQVEHDILFDKKDYSIRVFGTKSVNNKSELNLQDVLTKLIYDSKRLGDITNITMGIVSLSDTVSNLHIKKFGSNFKKGDGIYVLKNMEVEKLMLSKSQKDQYIKPFFKNSQIERYVSLKKNNYWLIYLRDNGLPIDLPAGLKAHFEKYKSIIVGLKNNFLKNEIAASVVKKWYANGNYFVLFTPKKSEYFEGQKIIAPYRNLNNIFSFSDQPFYGSKDIAYILKKNSLVDFRYLVCVLNSKLIYQWLFYRGKRKGKVLELYKKPLSEIPIKVCSAKIQKIFIDIFLSIRDKMYAGLSIDDDIMKIDLYAYKVYNLSFQEASIIEPDLSTRISNNTYDNINLDS